MHGFDTAKDSSTCFILKLERGFPMTACLPRLRREYLHLLPRIGRSLGTYVEIPCAAISMVAKAMSLPFVHVIALDRGQLL